MRLTLLGLFALLLSTPASLAAEERWDELPPPPLAGGTMALDTTAGRLLLLGGSTDGRGRITLWSISPDSSMWTDHGPLGEGPSPGNPFVFDAARRRFLAYGGVNSTPQFQTWELSLADSPLTWTALPTSGTPPEVIADYSLVHDTLRDRILLFGGLGPGQALSNRVYALQLGASPTWSELQPNGTLPSPRWGHRAVYDAARDRMVVHGGADLFQLSRRLLDETWALALAGPGEWGFMAPNGALPAARWKHTATVDGAGQRMVVLAGEGTTGNVLSDTWSLDLTEPTQARWTALPTLTGARSDHFAATDPASGALYFYGGRSAFQNELAKRTDLWKLSLAGPPVWSAMSPAAGLPLPLRSFGAAVDSASSTWFTFPGFSDPADPVTDVGLRSLATNDGWFYPPSALLSPREGRVVVADGQGRRAILFGGRHQATYYGDLIAFDFQTRSWTSLTPPATPPPRAFALGVFDPIERRLYVAGGQSEANGSSVWHADTWRYDIGADTWSPIAGASFGTALGAAGIIDARRGRLVAFGGSDSIGTRSAVRVLDLANPAQWQILATSGDLPDPANPETHAIYDYERDRMIVFRQAGLEIGAWQLALDQNHWTRLQPSGRIPIARAGYSVVADPARHRALLYGGHRDFGRNESWAFALDADATTPTLVTLNSVDASSERVRIQWSMGPASPSAVVASKRVERGTWFDVAELYVDAEDRVQLVDSEVIPGLRYEYRLGWFDGVTRVHAGHVTVEVPSASRFELLGAVPNPSRSSLRVHFRTAGSEPLAIECFDARGRLVDRRVLTHPTPGDHQLHLAGTRGLPPGIYYLRLKQGDRSAIRKAVLLD